MIRFFILMSIMFLPVSAMADGGDVQGVYAYVIESAQEAFSDVVDSLEAQINDSDWKLLASRSMGHLSWMCLLPRCLASLSSACTNCRPMLNCR